MPRPGQHIRWMALERRLKAILLLVAAGLSALFPFVLPLLLQAAASPLTVALPIWAYMICFGFTAICCGQARYLFRRARQADQGARGEEEIAILLDPLKHQGWQVEYGITDRSVGDIDVFLLSPKGNAYTIDVKSHRGVVSYSGEQLCRRKGQAKYPFEKDFLKQANRQAIAIKRLKQLRYVTAIVTFSNAKVKIGNTPIAGVYVFGKDHLLPFLLKQG